MDRRQLIHLLSGQDALKAVAPERNTIALNRMTFGMTATEMSRIDKDGLRNFIDDQLNPSEQDDKVNQKIAATQLHIKYDAKEDKYPAMDEDRPLGLWNSTMDVLWPLANYKTPMDGQERNRPLEEVRVVSWIKAVYSQWQLRELLTEFWHNHFNVNPGSDTKIAVAFPVYDRDVIRKNCFGNFRAFLEDVAQSTAMQYYLDNASSKASPANENYARELFELHTLGSDNYYNSLYNRWREVPGATSGKPIGYIDEDVYEAARSFTGWTIGDGAGTGKGENLPNTGTFYYQDGWHDNYQKRVLGVEFDPNQPPLADGKKVLDLVAFHPATAKHLCQKLCKRLISDNPPANVVKGAVSVWTKYRDSPHQIRETVRYILLSKEMSEQWGQKVKTPFELMASILRITDAEFTPNNALTGFMNQMGYLHYHWPTPTGHPDRADYWLSSNTMLARWNLAFGLLNNQQNKLATYDFKRHMGPELKTVTDVTKFWTERILQKIKPDEYINTLSKYLTHGKNINAPISAADLEKSVPQLISILTMTPDFQLK
jgi:uncharacterized protein (DUF1800 family)